MFMLSRLRMRARAIALPLLLFVLLHPHGISAQLLSPAQSDQTPGQEKRSLTGVVLNSATGEPIRRALVQLNGQAALTDNDGHFEFHGLPPGQTVLSASKPGFFSEEQVEPLNAPQVVHVTQEPDPVALKLVPEAVIFGRAETNGEPLEGVSINVVRVGIVDGRKRWQGSGSTVSDEDGNFRIANLLPGSYYITAGPKFEPGRRVRLPQAQHQTGFSKQFYPGSTDLEGATALDLTAGQQSEADFSFKPEPIYEVSGVLTGMPAGQPVEMQVMSRDDQTSVLPVQFDPASGKFQAQAPAGNYILRARALESDVYGAAAEFPLNVNSDRSDIRVALGSSAPIPVTVRREAVNPLSAGQQLPASTPLANVQLFVSEPTLGSQEYYANQGQGNLELALRVVPPGRYQADIASSNSEFYVASASCGGTDLLRDDLVVPAGGRVPPIEIVIQNDGASLTVSVPGNRRANVLLVPERAPRQIHYSPIFQSEGRFAGLAPGDYAVLALDSVDGLEYRNPDVLGPYLGRANHVTLLPNGQSSVAVELIHVEK
jgi:hypothetical protein